MEKKKQKKRRVSKVFSKSTEHYMEHTHWDFAPVLPEPKKIEELLKKAKNRIEDISTESICGAMDDMQHVEQYDGTLGVTQAFVTGHERPVGQLQWNDNLGTVYTNPGNVNGVRWGSGTLIANDLYITAGHCFDINPNGWQTPRDNATGMPVQPAQLALNFHVNFNFQVDPMGNLRPEQSFPVTQLVEYRLGGLDFAIARLGGNPGATFGIAAISSVDAADGDMLCIIQHPEGLPKRIEAGPQFHLHDVRVGYDTLDTLGGSSGSGILRATTGRLVGVHTNGGCDSSGAGHNHGVRITSIITNSPTVAGLLPSIKFSDDPKLKFVDDPITLKVTDDPKLKFVDDPVTIKFSDDPKLKFVDDPITIKSTDDPKLKFVDDPVTIKFSDDPKLKFVDDPITIKATDDPGTKKFIDDPVTQKFSDDPGTIKFIDDPVTQKFSDDPGTIKVIDDPVTQKFSDDPGTVKFTDDPLTTNFSDVPGGGNKAIDDVKMGGRDKAFSDGIDPRFGNINPYVTGAQPFVLSTPHHSNEWQQQYSGGAASSGEAQQLEQEITRVHMQLQQLYQHCGELEKYYQQLTQAYKASSGRQQ